MTDLIFLIISFAAMFTTHLAELFRGLNFQSQLCAKLTDCNSDLCVFHKVAECFLGRSTLETVIRVIYNIKDCSVTLELSQIST